MFCALQFIMYDEDHMQRKKGQQVQVSIYLKYNGYVHSTQLASDKFV